MPKKKTSEKKRTTIPKAVSAKKIAKAVEVAPTSIATPAIVVTPTAAPIIEDVTYLVSALHHMDADVARDAAASLGLSANPAAIQPLLEVLNNSDGYYHVVVRTAAIESLGKLGAKQAVPALIAAIRDPMAEASAEAVRALALIADASAISAMVEVVENVNGYFLPVVRLAAVIALKKLGGATAKSALNEVANNYDEDPVIRAAA